jgi:hypothetical protein
MARFGTALSVSAAIENVALAGALAETPALLAAQRAVLRYPGRLALDGVTARIGAPGSAASFTVAHIDAQLDEGFSGTIEGATARVEAVPLNFDEIAGAWRYEDERLTLSEASLRVSDRVEGTDLPRARFEPLVARGARLVLTDQAITATASLRNFRRNARIVDVALRHDLNTGEGEALLDVPGVTFGDGLSVLDLTYYAFGVVANTRGTVRGEGRIGWTPDDLTSTGIFRTESLDLAVAFGPIRGLTGEVRFSDLLGFTTEPGQTLRIGSINPGIEVLGGTLRFAVSEGEIIRIEDARWPFMGGELIMRPTTLRFGTEAEQNYIFEIVALDAARFVAAMELSNLGATGTFDGTVPVIFDAEANGRIEGGLLISRPPGGNVFYVGELIYEDLGAIGNYAFQALRSLDYSSMKVELDGDLAGEILTRFQIDGVRQGAGAQRNFVTRRLSGLPIRFNINVRSSNFYELATMVRTFWDADALPDPVDTGLLGTDGKRFVAPPPAPPPAPAPDPDSPLPDAIRPPGSTVQPSESEGLP